MNDGDKVSYKDIRGQLIIDSVTTQAHGVWRCSVYNKVATVTTDVMLLVKCKYATFLYLYHVLYTESGYIV